MKQRILSVLLVIVMVVSYLPMSTVSVVAADFSYVNESNTVQSAENCTAITAEMNRLSSGWYIVESDMTISSRLDIVGTVNLILADGATLTVGDGIHLPQGNTLKIYGQAEGTGALVSSAWTNLYASIGGNYQYQNTDKVGENCGDLYIYGGNITATGSGGGAGIGGGGSEIKDKTATDGKNGYPGGNGGNVYVYGGMLTAIGGSGAAGIGGGRGCDGNKGAVIQKGGNGGDGGNGGNLYVYGGSVTAAGGENAADIGGGKGGNGGNGGRYTYDSWQGKQGPGNGGDGGKGGAGGSITISGTTATLQGENGGGNGGAGGAVGQDMAGTSFSFATPGTKGSVGQSPVIFLADGASAPEGIAEDAMIVDMETNGNGALSATYDVDLSTVTFIPKPNKNDTFDRYESDTLIIEDHQTTFTAGKYKVTAKFADKHHIHDEIEYTKLTKEMLDSGSLSSGCYYLRESLQSSLNLTISKDADVTVCLNGETLNMGNGSITNNGTLTICDCGEGGKITADTTITSYGVVVNNGTFTMTSGTLERPNKAYGLENYGEATISGGTLYGKSSGIRNRSTGSLTITDGLISADSYALQTESTKDIIISGGEISGKYAIYNNGSGNIYISGGAIKGTQYSIHHGGTGGGTGTIYLSDGELSGGGGIYVYATGNVNMSGGTITATEDDGIYNFNTGKVTISGGNITSQTVGIYNSRDGSVEMTGGTVTGIEQTGISNNSSGSVSVSGGTIIAKTYGISAYGSGGVFFDDAQINSAGTGISVYKGSLTVAGGIINGTGSNGITVSATGTVTVSGGTITGKTYGIENKGTLYLSGSPSISRTSTGNGDIVHDKASIYAEDQNGVKYAGEALDIRVFYPSEGKEVILKVDDSNKDSFVLVNTSGGYVLKQLGNNLVLAPPHSHSWSTAWTSDGTYHWHECTADECDVTENSQKDGYSAHTPENDDGNCLTAIKCSKCKRELTPAATAHSFTDKASQNIASAADCQHKAKYYVQCDNCDVVSDTLTVEVGDFGNHNWDTEWSKDENNHWHKCLVVDCTEITDKNSHFSTGNNVATYTKKPICNECGIEYGDVVPDDVKPEGSITIYDNTWREFLHTITFGIFFKDTQMVEITTSDVGLGVNKAEYIFTETVYADADAVLNDTGITWKALTLDADGNTDFNIVPNDKGIVYLKITDKAGNVTVIRSDKVTIDNIAPVIAGIENGKTYCGAVEVTVSDEYFAKVTVNDAEVTVTDGKFTVAPADGKQKIAVSDKAGNETVVEITVNDEHKLIYRAHGNEFSESCVYGDHEAKAFIGIVGMTKDNNKKIYDEQAVEYEIRYEGEFLGKDNLTVIFKNNNGASLTAAPIDAGRYSVRISLNNMGTPGSYTFYILPKPVKLPEIESKVYTGETLTANIQDTELYTVITNNGGNDVGLYDVELKLKNYGNYIWEGFSGSETITLKFEITKATNEWVGEPSIRGWTYGESVNAPEAEAKFGTVQYTFCDAEGNELTGEPKNAGDYKVKVFVTGTDNYTGLTKELPFTIGKRQLTIKWTAPESLVYDGTAKMPYAEYNQGPTDDDEPQILIELTQGCDNINAGTFTFTAIGVDDSNYELTGDLVSPEYTITARLLLQSDFTAAIDGLVYNGSAITPVVESTTALVTAEDYTVAYESNINAGENTAKIIITGKRNATGSVEILFSIAKADYPNIVWPQNLAGNHGDKLSTVQLLEGFTWDNQDEIIKYGNGHEYAATYTPNDIVNYKVAHGSITVNGADVTAPTGTVTIGENSWNALWNDITFGLFFKETQTVKVTAEDTESGITATEYYLAAEKTDDFTDVQWTAFDGSFDINPDNKYVVYIRITNGAGYKTIINSDGVVLDSIVPVIFGIENGKDVYGDATFTVDEDNLDTVTVDGNKVDAVESKYTIVADNAEHTVVVTDQSGNSTEYKLTVYKNYTVTFMAEGKEITKQVVGYGKDAELPEIPAKDGYTAKWNADGKNITADITITAEYTKIPKTDSPQTGDNSNMALWIALPFVSGLGIVVTTALSRKRKNN